MNRLPSFEEKLVPLSDRVICAMGNLANDFAQAHPNLKREVALIATSLRGYIPLASRFTHLPKPRVLVMNLLLPVGCNATCPNVCGTDVSSYRIKRSDLNLGEIIALISEFKALGGRVLRIVGVGEPTLYPGLPAIARFCEQLGISVLVCTNGISIPEDVLAEYSRADSTLHFEVKLWSENEAEQTRMVGPKGTGTYTYVDLPRFGKAPKVFADLWERNKERVGFRVLVYRDNEDSARAILAGPKPKLVPTYVDYFIPQGEGRDHGDLRIEDSEFSPTCFFTKIPWSLFAVSVKQDGQMVGVLERDSEGISIRGGLLGSTWPRVFTELDNFFALRYGKAIPFQL